MTSTNSGEAFDTEDLAAFDSEDAAVEAFSAHLFPENEDARKRPSDDEGEDQTPESTSEEDKEEPEQSDESPDDEGSDEDDKEVDPPAKKYGDDETYVKVKVGEEEHEVPVKDLKRLWGQETALTKRGQEIADQRRAVEQQQQVYLTRTNALLQHAKAKADQFRTINWMELARDPNVPKEQLDTLQAMAQQAFQEETYLNQEAEGVVKEIQQAAQTKIAEQARETIKVLSDQASPLHIADWSQETYGSMLKFATSMGVPAQIANQITDAPTLKLLHMAMAYAQGAKKVQTVQKTAKTPKKIIKTPSAQTPPTSSKAATVKKTMARLAKTGSEDDAIAAIAARLGGSED